MQLFLCGCRLTATLILLLLLQACATPPQSLQLLKSPPDIPSRVELESVPFYAQRDYQCGPAALATIINHYHKETTPEELLPLVYIPELKGTLQIELKAAAKRFDRLAVELDGKLISILREVANGNPVLVMQNLGLGTLPFWHYAVIIGYDLQNQQIILRSGEIKRLVRPFAVFERTWQRAANWSLVMVPPDVIPETVSEKQYINAAVELEAGPNPQAGQLAYKTAIKHWPNNYVLQMGLGNSSYRVKDFHLAKQAFRAATEIQPDRPEAWNNLAYALLNSGDGQQALKAIEQSIILAPDNEEYQKSKAEIVNQNKVR